MRMLRRNQQKMFYAVKTGVFEVYETDDDGNIVYDEFDGERIPITTGEKRAKYGFPTEFWANINGRLNNAIIRAFGVDNSDNHAQLVTDRDEFDFKVGTRIWLHSEPVVNEDGSADGDTADYEVRGVMKEGLNEDLYYLVVLNHEDVIEEQEDETEI